MQTSIKKKRWMNLMFFLVETSIHETWGTSFCSIMGPIHLHEWWINCALTCLQKKIGMDPRLDSRPLSGKLLSPVSRWSRQRSPHLEYLGLPRRCRFTETAGRTVDGWGWDFRRFSCGTDFWYVYTGPSPWDDRILLGNCDVVIESHRVEVVWCLFFAVCTTKC